MNIEATGFWDRALITLKSARLLLDTDPDSSASCSYYSAFYAVSALFALRDKFFTKHSAVEAAVHRDLVKVGYWSSELGANYSYLINTRITGDYGILKHVSENQAKKAIQSAQHILLAVHKAHPDVFTDRESLLCQDLA